MSLVYRAQVSKSIGHVTDSFAWKYNRLNKWREETVGVGYKVNMDTGLFQRCVYKLEKDIAFATVVVSNGVAKQIDQVTKHTLASLTSVLGKCFACLPQMCKTASLPTFAQGPTWAFSMASASSLQWSSVTGQ